MDYVECLNGHDTGDSIYICFYISFAYDNQCYCTREKSLKI